MHVSVTIGEDSPWFSGHFPGDPILPGIAQLKMVADLIVTSGKGQMRMAGLSRVKFRKIVRPGDLLDIYVECGEAPDQYSFKITSGNEDVCSGWMYINQKENTRSKE